MQPLASVHNQKRMKINFTKKQFTDLLKLVYLGNWVINAHRTESTKNQYQEMESYVFSFADQFGLDSYVDKDDGETAYPTAYFEDTSNVQQHLTEYDEETFWDELVDRLAERDTFAHLSPRELKQIDPEKLREKLYANAEKWSNEFEQHGLTRLQAVQMTMRTEDESSSPQDK